MIELKNVCKTYRTGEDTTQVLAHIDCHVEKGEAVVVVGPSGCGKSTLLNLMGALDRPTSGQVLLAGHDLAGLSDKEMAEVRRRDIGFIFQMHHLLDQCTVLENVLIPTLAEKNSAVPMKQRAEDLLAKVGLADRLNYRPGQLSGGQRQRVAVARALINDPKIVLADEPTGSLDPKTGEQIGDLLLHLQEEQDLTLVMVTHAQNLARRFRRVLTFADGQLTESC